MWALSVSLLSCFVPRSALDPVGFTMKARKTQVENST